MTLQVIAKIHFEALTLWLQRAPVFRHPRPPPTESMAIPAQRSAL